MFKTKKMNEIRVNDIKTLLGQIDLIDIREPYEYQFGHIPSAKNIPMDTILTNPGQFLDQNKEYYVVCQSGGRSSMACSILKQQGYNVINVIGGTGNYNGQLE